MFMGSRNVFQFLQVHSGMKVKVKVKVKVKAKFTLSLATKAQSWSRGIALLFL
jgi:hypothetical protein